MNHAYRCLQDVPSEVIDSALKRDGLLLDYGACRVRVDGTVPGFAERAQQVYGHFPYLASPSFADLHVRLLPGSGLRRFVRPQVRFAIDGVEPFDPFPGSDALPLFEWGVNWCFGKRFNQHVLLHAGVLARGDRALLMPAVPGSGKSTLTAALMLSGFRLLSDEFGVLRPEDGSLLPMLKPVAIKNAAIDVIRAFSADAHFGPVFSGTRKGDVAHLRPDAASVAAVHRPARPAFLVFPRWEEGAELSLVPQTPEQSFAKLAFNSFNYGLLGPVAFHAVADLTCAVRAYRLTYSRLPEAVDCIRRLFDGVEC